MSPEEQREADIALLRQACDRLGESFDCVQIFASRHMPAELDGTRVVNYGSGNWYARYGQVKHWLIEHEEVCRELSRRDVE